MNSRGEVERALGTATLGLATKAVIRALFAWCDNKTGVVPWGKKEAPTVAELAAVADCSERTVQRALAEAQHCGWLIRHRSPPGTVAGELRTGRDASERKAKVCQGPKCTKTLKPGKRADAVYCSERCKRAGSRASKRLVDLGASGTVSDTEGGQKRQIAGTLPSSEHVEGGLSLEKGLTQATGDPTEVPAAAMAKDGPPFPLADGFQGAPEDATGRVSARLILGPVGGPGESGLVPRAQPLTTSTGKDHPDHVVTQGEGGNPGGARGAKIAAERRERLRGWYAWRLAKGATVLELADELGLTRVAVRRDITVLGLTLPGAQVYRTDPETVELIHQLAEEGWSQPEIAEMAEVTLSTAYRYASEVPYWKALAGDRKARAAAARRRRVTRLLAQQREEGRSLWESSGGC